MLNIELLIYSASVLLVAISTSITLYTIMERILSYIKAKKAAFSSETTKYEVATIMDDMGPAFLQIIDKGDIILITGGDLHYLKNKKRTFLKYIKKWIKKGASIEYIVPKEEDTEEILEYVNEQLKKEGLLPIKIKYYEDDVTLSILDKKVSLQEFHPSFIFDKKVSCDKIKAAWVEENHPPESLFAFNVEFYPPGWVKINKRDVDKRNRLKLICNAIINIYNDITNIKGLIKNE